MRGHGEDNMQHYPEKAFGAVPPADRGRGAWLYLLGCYGLEGSVWGLALSWGVFQNHYGTHAPFSSHAKALPTVGTCAAAIAHFGFPIITPIMQRYPRCMVPFLYAGFCICLLSLVLASFANNVAHLILTQGLLFGVGWAICYTPFLLMLNQWFVTKRGTAYGILFGSSGLFAMILPFALEAGLKRYGFRITLRLTALGIFLVSGPGMLLIKPRIKTTAGRPQTKREQYATLLRNSVFFIFCTGVFLQGVTWFLPRFFLPSFAADLSLTRENGAALLAAFGVAQVAGQLFLGWLSDKVSVHVPVTLSTGISATATLLLWAPANQIMPDNVMVPLVIFAMLYGGFGGGYVVVWTRIARVITADEDAIMAIYSVFAILRGLGNVFSGPVSAVLLSKELMIEEYALRKYKGVAIFVGVGMLLSALTAVSVCLNGKSNGVGEDQKGRETEMEPFVATSDVDEEHA